MSEIRWTRLWLLFALALLGAGAWLAMRSRETGGAFDNGRLTRLETENRELRARSDQMARELESLRQSVPQPASEAEAKPGEPRPPRQTLPAGLVDQARMLGQTRDKLDAANASIQELHFRIRELEAGAEKAAQENKRLAESEAELKERLASVNRLVEAIQTELKGKEGRLAHLETVNTRLREEARAEAAKTAQLPQALRDLEEVDRRRETYLGNILRRYKDVTEQYRALSGRLENQQENAMAFSSELGRIRESVAMAEEDLRQLGALNTQASRIRRRLAP